MERANNWFWEAEQDYAKGWIYHRFLFVKSFREFVHFLGETEDRPSPKHKTLFSPSLLAIVIKLINKFLEDTPIEEMDWFLVIANRLPEEYQCMLKVRCFRLLQGITEIEELDKIPNRGNGLYPLIEARRHELIIQGLRNLHGAEMNDVINNQFSKCPERLHYLYYFHTLNNMEEKGLL